MIPNYPVPDTPWNLQSYCPCLRKACYHYSFETIRDRILEFLPMSSVHLEGSLIYHTERIWGPILVVIAPESIWISIKSLPTFLLFVTETLDHLGWKRLPWPIKMTSRSKVKVIWKSINYWVIRSLLSSVVEKNFFINEIGHLKTF